jgi:hypothetical protein
MQYHKYVPEHFIAAIPIHISLRNMNQAQQIQAKKSAE